MYQPVCVLSGQCHRSRCFPTAPSSTMGLFFRADNSQPLLQLLSQEGQVEQVTEGGVELASEDKEQESDAKVSGFAKYFWSRKIFSEDGTGGGKEKPSSCNILLLLNYSWRGGRVKLLQSSRLSSACVLPRGKLPTRVRLSGGLLPGKRKSRQL